MSSLPNQITGSIRQTAGATLRGLTHLALPLVGLMAAGADSAPAQPVTVTQSLQRCGLGSVYCAAYSSDGKHFATGSAIGGVLWDSETGDVIRIMSGHTSPVYSVALSPDGTKALTGGSLPDCSAKLWDTKSGAEIHTFSGHTGSINSVAFSPDGTKIATGSNDSSLKIWDVATGLLIRTMFAGSSSRIYSIAFSPDGLKVLAGLDNNSAKLWNVSNGAVIRAFPGHTSAIYSVAFSPDGTKVLTGSGDWTAKLWDEATGAIIRTFTGHTMQIWSVAYSPDGTKVVTGSYDRTAKVWNADSGNEIRSITAHSWGVDFATFSPDGTMLFTCGYDTDAGGAKLWNAATGALLRTYAGHTPKVSCVAFSPDATKVLTGYWISPSILWDAVTGREIRKFSHEPSTRIGSVGFSPDGTKILTAYLEHATLSDAATGAVIRDFYPSGSIATLSPDGTKVLTNSAINTAKLWDTSTGSLIRTFSGHASAISSVAFSSDGTRILTGSSDNTAKLWDTTTGAVLLTFSGHTSPVYSAVFSPDGTRVLTGSIDATAKIWDGTTGVVILTIASSGGVATFSPDGRNVLTNCLINNTARLWDATTGGMIRTFSGHTEDVSAVAFSSDGTRILTGSEDGTARIWEIRPPKALIVAGGGEFGGNAIGGQTEQLAAYAYDTLRKRGYEAQDILYLTAFGPEDEGNPGQPFRDADGDGVNDADGWATLENLQAAFAPTSGGGGEQSQVSSFKFQGAPERGDGVARDSAEIESATSGLEGGDAAVPQNGGGEIPDGVFQNDGSGTTWRAREGGRLSVFLIDHGYKTDGFMVFRVNETQAVSATTFAGWMDALQEAAPAVDLQLVIDTCYSGAFIEPLQNNPAFASRRVLLASTSPTEESLFLPPPDLTSFMFNFLSSAYMGNSFGEAWRSAGRFFRAFPVADQAPLMWDGTTSGTVSDETTTFTLADRMFFGRSWVYGVQSRKDVNQFFPAFAESQPIKVKVGGLYRDPAVITPGETFTIEARLQPFQRPTSVTLAVRPPAPDVVTGQPVTALPRVALALAEDTWSTPGQLWAATIDTAPSDATFHTSGTYLLSATARFEFNRVSNPELATVLVSAAPDPDVTPIRAVVAVGAGPDAAQSESMAALGAQSYEVSLGRFRDADGAPHPEWIEYLTPLAGEGRDGNSNDKSQLLMALRGEVFDAEFQTTATGRLYVHLIGPSAPAGFDADTPATPALVLAGDGATTLTLDVLEVRDALDAYQAGGVLREVVVLLDMPRAGSWLGTLGAAKRIVVCSARPEDEGLYLPGAERTGSFSGRFMLAAATGANLRESFRSAQNFFRAFTSQAPWYDDSGDGRFGNESWTWRFDPQYGDPAWAGVAQDGAWARERWWGRRYAFAGDESGLVPFVLGVEPTSQTLSAAQMTTLTATLLEGVEPVSVVARLLPPRSVRAGSDAGLIEIAMTSGATPVTWTANFAAPTEPGEWAISVVAQYADGLTSEGATRLRDSEPVAVSLTVLGGPMPDVFDLFFDEDTSGGLVVNRMPVNYPQQHNFDGPDDEDWFSFYARANQPYSVRIDGQADDVNAVLDIYLNAASTPTLTVNDGLEGPGEYELATLVRPTSQTVHVRLRNAVRGGAQTTYTLRVSRDVGPYVGVPTVGMHQASVSPGSDSSIPGSGSGSLLAAVLETTAGSKPLDGGGSPSGDHYDQVRFTFPAGSVGTALTAYLTGAFNVPGEPEPSSSGEYAEALQHWQDDEPIRGGNFTPVELSLEPFAPGTPLGQPLVARMQFLPGGQLLFPESQTVDVEDLPDGTSAVQAEIWAWNVAAETWERVASPEPPWNDAFTIDGYVVTVSIPPDRLLFTQRNEQASSIYLALAPTAPEPTPTPEPPALEVSEGAVTRADGETLNVGVATQGGAAPEAIFTVGNTGQSALEIANLTLPAGWTLSEGLDGTIAAGNSDDFTIVLPTTTAGYSQDDLVLSTNDPLHATFSLTVVAGIRAWGTTPIWVDFDHAGMELGTQLYPYALLLTGSLPGATAVAAGGTVRIRSGTTPETQRIVKAMRLEAVGGLVRIGVGAGGPTGLKRPAAETPTATRDWTLYE
jgi:WD40 repeat protein